MPPRAKTAKSDAPAAATNAAVHVFYGTDDFAANKAADALLDQICPPADRDFSLEIIEPSVPDPDAAESAAVLDRAMGAILTPSFLGTPKTVYLRNAPFFDPMTDPGKFADVKTRVERLTELLRKGLPPGINLLVVTPKLSKLTAFYKLVAKTADVREFAIPEKERDAADVFFPALQQALADEHLEMPPDVRDAFVDRIGFSTRQAISEIQKLSLYLGPTRRRVTLADLQLMVAPTRESKPWDFTDAYCTGSVEAALRAMHRLLDQKNDPITLLILLEKRLREMVLFSDAIARDWARVGGKPEWPTIFWSATLPPEAEAAYEQLEESPRRANPYFAGRLAAASRRFSPATWFRWLNAAVDAHADMTGDAFIPPETSLELFVIRTIGSLTKTGRHAR